MTLPKKSVHVRAHTRTVAVKLPDPDVAKRQAQQGVNQPKSGVPKPSDPQSAHKLGRSY